uniref:Uncharacterized protein n=1 Tax=Arundo donax TaxID=35708 RepID=A0A0A9DWH5_ARUDO
MGEPNPSPLPEALALKTNVSFQFQSHASPIAIFPFSSLARLFRVFSSSYPLSTLSSDLSPWGLSHVSPSPSSPCSAAVVT